MPTQTIPFTGAAEVVDEVPFPMRQHLSRADNRMSIMLVCPFDEHLLCLLSILQHTNWAIYWATNCADALTTIRTQTIPAVLCERDLPDGSWNLLIEEVAVRSPRSRFIVASRLPDDAFWMEAMSRGAFDILSKPFDADEVVRVIRSACYSWSADPAGRKADGKAATRA